MVKPEHCTEAHEGGAGCDVSFPCYNNPTRCIRQPVVKRKSPCKCAHAFREHDHDDNNQGGTQCLHEDCDCIEYHPRNVRVRILERKDRDGKIIERRVTHET